MFELRFAGRSTYVAQVPPGLYRLGPAGPDEAAPSPDLLPDGALSLSPAPGREARIVLPANGGLISNLRVWENVVLPRWYHVAKLDDDLELQTVAWVRRLLPYVEEPAEWLHRSVGQLPADERCLAGLIRSLVAPASWLFIEAAWADPLDAAQLRLCAAALAGSMAAQGRIALVYSPQAPLSGIDLLWEPHTSALTWTAA